MNNLPRKKILILFDGGHLAYSPTIIQLYEQLEKNYEVLIVAPEPTGFTTQKLLNKSVIYYNRKLGSKRYFFRLLFELKILLGNKNAIFFNNPDNGFYPEYFLRFKFIQKLIRRRKIDRILSVDMKNLCYCTLMNKKSDFLSLELCQDERLLKFVNQELINCVIIQTNERYRYLFGDKSFKTFFVQNAPIYEPLEKIIKRGQLVYAGTAWDAFGFFFCLDYLKKFKSEKLFVQGIIPEETRIIINEKYPDLIQEGRLILSSEYLSNSEVVAAIAECEIGFCFYNFSIGWINNFNYRSAPSGKLFKYLAAGIPVVCNNIIGFEFVKKYKCGVLIDNLSEDGIHIALTEIRSNYKSYSNNALTVAQEQSFDKTIKPYLEYLKYEINK